MIWHHHKLMQKIFFLEAIVLQNIQNATRGIKSARRFDLSRMSTTAILWPDKVLLICNAVVQGDENLKAICFRQ